MTEAERRTDFACDMFEWGKRDHEEGWGGHPPFFYDTPKNLFRFVADGTFALSRDYANWPALKEAGFFREYGM